MESVLTLAANNGALGDVLTLVGALILVALTVVAMKVIERARRSSSTRELKMRRTTAEAEAAKIVAEARDAGEAVKADIVTRAEGEAEQIKSRAGDEIAQDRDRVFHGWLFRHDGLKASFQGCVFFYVFPIFIQCRGADRANFTPS
ncbi:hypothetical protein LCGC14_0019550 [marine sediment metagenome]|uniref:Uncharacterized protein n=1 Tax=marine sediment metagenome TaxID=412755 RepID=A0A0F9Z2X7_9ZZZZ